MISVVIPTRDRRSMLARTLAPLVGRDDVDVIVVDDGSVDGSGEEAAALGARVVRSPTPRGPAAARNAGLAGARHDRVLFLDSDIVVGEDYLDSVMACHDLVDDLVLAGLRRQLPADGVGGGSRRDSREALAETWSYNLMRHPHPWAAAFSCVLSAPRSLLDRAALPGGVFDEELQGWGLEDIELGLRLHDSGARWALGVGLRIEHQYHDRTMSSARFEGWQANLERMLARHPQAAAYRELSPAFDPSVRADFVECFRAFSPVPVPTRTALVVRGGDRVPIDDIRCGLREDDATVYLVMERLCPQVAVELLLLDGADRVALFDQEAFDLVGPELVAGHDRVCEVRTR